MVETETIIMKRKDKGVNGKLGKFSILLYVVAAIVAISGIAMLAVNIYIFKSTIDQYVAQGYPAEMVMQSLVPSQLLPGIFEPIALYGGLVFVLLGVAIMNSKISQHIMGLTETVVAEDDTETADSTEYNTEYVDPTDIEENIEIIGLADSEIAMEAEEDDRETKNA